MKAAVCKGKQQLSVEEIPTPEPGPAQVLVKVRFCALCGTDVHGWLYDAVPVGTVLGHEYSGTVAALGPGVTRWREGDRVMGGGGQPPPGKGAAFATSPRFNFRTVGFHARPLRAYAEYVLMEEWEPLPIPDGVSDEEAAMCEPASVAVRAVRKSELRVGDTVAVLGAGPIGMLTVQAALAAGAGSVFVSEPSSTRRNAAVELGARDMVDPTTEDVVDRMVEFSGGTGPDVAFDCAGVGPTLDQALNMVRRDGQVVLIALAWEPVSVLPVDWIGREVKLQSTFGGRHEDWVAALDLIAAGKMRMGPMLDETGFIHLGNIQQAFEALVKPSTQRQMVVRMD